MNGPQTNCLWGVAVAWGWCCALLPGALLAQSQPDYALAAEVRILGIEGTVEFCPTGTTRWFRADTNVVFQAGDRVRTRENSRLTLRWFDHSTVRLPQFAELEVEAPPGPKLAGGFKLLKGLLYFFHRDKPTAARFNTRTASAAVRGTEFVLEYREAEDRTILTVLDGAVTLTNTAGEIRLASGEQGSAEPGAAPRKTAVLQTIHLIQWCLYYPGVLDLAELELDAEAQAALVQSLAAYRNGDLLQALGRYPTHRLPQGPNEKVYLAALQLSVGQVTQAEEWLKSLAAETPGGSRPAALAAALQRLIAAVKLQPVDSGRTGAEGGQAEAAQTPPANRLATEWLAESYYQQARTRLPEALAAAKQAVKQSPQFGLGGARLAELEFSFGHTTEALAALEQGLARSPRNAQAVALKGFLLSAQNRIDEAMAWFDQALALDSGLGNAWLGRGLCRIRQGKVKAGRDDLQMAVTVEPQRALFRSYLAKAYQEAGDGGRARREIRLARDKDPADPTSWLYSALLNQQENRVNAAVSDLEKSQERNDNRSVYRSRLLLDQDRAVRGANLAAIYRDAGLFEVSVREAGRAVSADYANYSAHLFLANSYYEMLNTPQVNQRYEAARVNEYLMATLLAPVGSGALSPRVSQQEYAKLFERDRLGITYGTEYLSRGALTQYAAQYGTIRNTSYSLEVDYGSDRGQRPNQDWEQTLLSLQVKQQLSPRDTVFFQMVYSDGKYGDLAQYYTPAEANGVARHKETQEPLLLLGYHREWAPGNHSLLLAGRLQDTLRLRNPTFDIGHPNTLVLGRDGPVGGPVLWALPYTVQQLYRGDLEIYTLEAQQIFQRENHAIVLGGRFQTGGFTTRNTNALLYYTNAANTVLEPDWFVNPPQRVHSGFARVNVYGYAHWQPLPALRFIAGLSGDWLRYPVNHRFAPLSRREDTTGRFSPKAGLIWSPWKDTAMRAAYSRSLGGVSFDQSFQLEPSQVAGFNQAWRSLIPESVAGANAAAQFEAMNVALEHKFPTRTYLGLSGERLWSKANRTIGVFDYTPMDFTVFPMPPNIFQSGAREQLRFEERSLAITVNQLVGEGLALGARYSLSRAQLHSRFPDIPATAVCYGGFAPAQNRKATLQQANLYAVYNHPLGLFAGVEALWVAQDNAGYAPPLPGDEVWQFNAQLGYRFPRRQAELRLALLNLTDQNYRFNPLNLRSELPRARTLAVSFRMAF